MGNSQGGKSKNLSGQDLIDILNSRSLQGNSNSPDTVNYQGISMYLNEQAGQNSNWRPSYPVERVNRYRDVADMAKKNRHER